jgi:hypothetical protein
MTCLLSAGILLAILLKFVKLLEDWSWFMKLMTSLWSAGVMLACGSVGLPIQAIYGVAFLWSVGVLLACCSFDSPMQAICLKLVERPAFDLLVSCWSAVPWIRRCKRFAWSWWCDLLFCRLAGASESCGQDSIWRAAQACTFCWFYGLVNLHTCTFWSPVFSIRVFSKL